jgi:DNA-binding NtrC family response regulator
MEEKMRILIVDDEPHWVEFAQKDLRNDLNRFIIDIAKDKQTALEALARQDYTLVIASSRRLDVLEAIRKQHTNNRVIVTTIQPTTTEARDAYSLGALRYFPKSFNPHDLLKRVKEVIA